MQPQDPKRSTSLDRKIREMKEKMAESRTVLDAEFQKALIEGLRHVGQNKPRNPVHELGNFLLSYRRKA